MVYVRHPSDRLVASSSRAPGAPRNQIASGLCDWQFKRVRSHIDQHIDRPIPVRELAGLAKLSLSRFSRAFALRTGLSPHAYLTKERIKLAQSLLTASNDSLADIAVQCGLCDEAHLSRLFKRQTGKPPGRWRREARGGLSVILGDPSMLVGDQAHFAG